MLQEPYIVIDNVLIAEIKREDVIEKLFFENKYYKITTLSVQSCLEIYMLLINNITSK